MTKKSYIWGQHMKFILSCVSSLNFLRPLDVRFGAHPLYLASLSFTLPTRKKQHTNRYTRSWYKSRAITKYNSWYLPAVYIQIKIKSIMWLGANLHYKYHTRIRLVKQTSNDNSLVVNSIFKIWLYNVTTTLKTLTQN